MQENEISKFYTEMLSNLDTSKLISNWMTYYFKCGEDFEKSIAHIDANIKRDDDFGPDLEGSELTPCCLAAAFTDGFKHDDDCDNAYCCYGNLMTDNQHSEDCDSFHCCETSCLSGEHHSECQYNFLQEV